MHNPHNDNHFYIWNTFYYNKEDGRFFVPKKIRYLGYTINLAHPAAIPSVIITLLVMFLLSLAL